ncbi:contractile injection system tape measure protein [Chitinophaga sp. MM2321]|uniref:contractile injection system tape measure protein n=1 Tax=Chitinophaga sp. MM2321 TaxID=3137178 RepID=UPI0032D5B0FF
MTAHIIQRYSFDVQFDSRKRAFALQDQVSMLFHNSITPDTHQLLQQLIPEDMMAVMDTLVLDIGTIPLKDIATEMPPRIMAALEKVLTDLLHNGYTNTQHNIAGDVTIRKGDDRLFELMTFFLFHGIMPWWATTNERRQPGEVMLHLAKTSPARLAGFLRSIAQNAYVRERMVLQFNISILHAIVQVLEPSEALFIIAYSREILQIQQQQQVLHTETSELEKAVWLFILAYLVVESGTNFNRKQFVRSNLTRMARNFNLSYETLLELFYEALAFYTADLPDASAGGFIKNLYEELFGKEQRKSFLHHQHAHKNIMNDTGEQISILRYYLLYGSIPWWAPSISVATLQDMLAYTGHHAGNALKQLLQTVLQQHNAASRWTSLVQAADVIVKRDVHLQEIKIWADDTIAANATTQLVIPGARHVLLRDVILHLLTYGSISWWGKKYAHYSLNSLLEQLATQHPEQTLTILEYAGTIPAAMQRLITGVSAPVFFRLLRHTGMDTAAEEVYDNLYSLLSAIHLLLPASVYTPEQLVLQALWQSLAATRYRRVNKQALLQHLLMPGWPLSATAAPHVMHFLLQQLLPAVSHLSGSTQLADDLQEWISHLPELLTWQEADTVTLQALLEKITAAQPQLATTTSSGQRPLIAARSLLQRMQQYAAITTEDKRITVQEEARRLLTVYLTRYRLPEELGSMTLSATHALIKAAVILLFKAAPAILHQLFTNYRQHLAARLQVYSLFSFHAGIPESHIRESLDTYAIRDSLLLLQETSEHHVHGGITGLREAIRFYKQRSQQERKSFYSKILQHPALVQQMAQHLDDDTFLDLMQDAPVGWTGNTRDALRELQQLFAAQLSGSQEKAALQLAFRRFHLLLLGGHIYVYDVQHYAASFLTFIVTTAPAIADSFITRLSVTSDRVTALSYTNLWQLLPVLRQQATAHVTGNRHRVLLRESIYEKDRSLIPPATASVSADAKRLPQPVPEETAPRTEVKTVSLDTIYTGNAGLIILHPFLAYGFKRIGLLNEEGFVNREAQHRAVHVLQYMVNGKEEHPEHELALNKILCNLPLKEPVPAVMLLTAEEKQLCTELLQVVLQRWDKMNNSSIEGFQAAFLQREGALWQKDDDWWLRVEQRGYDMILQTLPWGIGMIKTPWMEKTLYTEWVHS